MAKQSMDPVQRLVTKINALEKRIKRVETSPRLQDSSIDEGALYVLSDEGLIVGEPGSATGSARIYGKLLVDGIVELIGKMTMTGDITIPGALPIVLKIVGGVPRIEVGEGVIRGFEDGIGMTAGTTNVFLTPEGATFIRGTWALGVTEDGPSISAPEASSVEGLRWLAHDAQGNIVSVDPATGGPIGMGQFEWPFPLTLVTKEYDPNDPGYTNGHLGIDFGSGAANTTGTPIPAAATGTVVTTDFDSERGWQVILDHGERGGYRLTTRYYHLHQQSPLADGELVQKGDPIGGIGSTGDSTGAHLHFETRRDGVAMNPRSFMDIYGE